MSSLRPDGRSQGAPLNTPQEGDSKAANAGPNKARLGQPQGPHKPQASAPFAGDNLESRPKQALSQSLPTLPSPMKMPEGGQATSAASAPASTTHVKDAAKKSGANEAALQQKAIAEALIGADGTKPDARIQELSHRLMAMTLKKEGFKAVVATRAEPAFVGLVCHDLSQLDKPKGVDHLPLAKEMALTFSSAEAMPLTAQTPQEQKTQRIKLRNAITMAVMSRGQKEPKPAEVSLAGTRLCRAEPSGPLTLEPSGSYGCKPDTMPKEALGQLAKLHANLLVGAGVSKDLVQCHADHPGLQPLVDAIVALMPLN